MNVLTGNAPPAPRAFRAGSRSATNCGLFLPGKPHPLRAGSFTVVICTGLSSWNKPMITGVSRSPGATERQLCLPWQEKKVPLFFLTFLTELLHP